MHRLKDACFHKSSFYLLNRILLAEVWQIRLQYPLPIMGIVPFVALLATTCYVLGQPMVEDEDPMDVPYLERHSVCNPDAGSVHQFTVGTLDGFTPQYLEFNPLVRKYNNQGLFFAGFPCNQFDLQEPGKDSEILNGIKHVRPGGGYEPAENFHIYGKLEVNGKNAHPMYKFLKSACPAHGERLGSIKNYYWDDIYTYDIVWNFEKFIIDRQGRPRYRFHPAAWQHGRFVERFLTEIINDGRGSASTVPTNSSQSTAPPRNITSPGTSRPTLQGAAVQSIDRSITTSEFDTKGTSVPADGANAAGNKGAIDWTPSAPNAQTKTPP